MRAFLFFLPRLAHIHSRSREGQGPLCLSVMVRILHFLVVLLCGLATAQQQALMDYLERRLLAIEVSSPRSQQALDLQEHGCEK